MQKLLRSTLASLVLAALGSCGDRLEEKGFAVSSQDTDQVRNANGIAGDSSSFLTRPSNVLLTGIPEIRLVSVYKVNYNRDSISFIGSNDYHHSYSDIGETNGNQWHHHYLPGFEAVYGYNMVNVSYYSAKSGSRTNLFQKPVLIKTLYYPSFSRDTLNFMPVTRKFLMISVYDDDTNGDGYINAKDLRRFYHFDINGGAKSNLVPSQYSVFKSEYDPANDFLSVFATLDENNNGQIEDPEPIHIFYVDLKNPRNTGRVY